MMRPFSLLILSSILWTVSGAKQSHFIETDGANVIGAPVENVNREKCLSLCREKGTCKGITMYHPSNNDVTVCYMTKKGKNGWRDDQYGRHEFTSIAMVTIVVFDEYQITSSNTASLFTPHKSLRHQH